MLAATYNPGCLVAALRKLFAYNPQPLAAPLFALGGAPFTSAAFQSALLSNLTRLGIDTIGIKGYSFRKGAAQHAYETGLLNEQIQTLGR